MKFFGVPVGEQFYVDGEVCKKTSALGYTKANEHVLGEFTIDPVADKKLETQAEYDARTKPAAAEVVAVAAPAPKKVAAKKSPTKKAPAKKAKKK